MTSVDVAAQLDELAVAIARLRPISNRYPERFYEERSEIASRARGIADGLRAPKAPRAELPARTIGPQSSTHETRHLNGRTVHVLTRSERSKGR